MQVINESSIDYNIVLFLRKTYTNDVDVDALEREISVLKVTFSEHEVYCLNDVLNGVKGRSENERSLIPNI